ncbi:MAG: 3-deoxy-D-arabino-heptulosonate 7-phosphate synthase [Leptospiraceae bacterium]|nr:3-deoxy-D-arabino-heptulosonate 7-phosphate synthase [Leptospiraceae bacterium]MCB1170831.1 3-deoxy-D-arabino-heptulosonate 7-phosphate synthase [Leptospiraceae bacterium]
MIIPVEDRFSEEQFQEVESILSEFGCSLSPIQGATRTIYAIRGDEREELMINRLEGLPYVSRVDTIQSPYKLMDIKSELYNHEMLVGGKVLSRDLLVIAGQCTIDPKNPRMFLETAHAVKEAGADVIRGGIWKPRTSPHTYQGSSQAVDILLKAAEETGLPVNTEVMDEEQLQIAVDAGVPMLQVGARNALNYSLLKKIGAITRGKGTKILLKRSMHMGPISEFICAAEYIVAAGNPNVMLCPRGTVPGLDGYRNHPDESITPLLKQKTWAPVVVDPSHSVGRSIYVPHSALAAVAYGADGLVIESHVDPRRGIGDDPKQAITPDVLGNVIADARELFQRVRKYQESYVHQEHPLPSS